MEGYQISATCEPDKLRRGTPQLPTPLFVQAIRTMSTLSALDYRGEQRANGSNRHQEAGTVFSFCPTVHIRISPAHHPVIYNHHDPKLCFLLTES